ncbi:MAG: serine/threonine-protein kinase [Catenulispora sp.]
MSGADAEHVVADRYRLLTRIGRGGMGEVWSARDLRLHRDVAVKIFHGGPGPGAASLPDWLRREGIAAAQIVHPNVAVLYDQGAHQDQIFLVMELVSGATLADVMRGGRLPVRDALRIGSQVAEALAAAHAARVVHRDIKPQNVLVTPDGTVKVVDFGIAGFLADTRSWSLGGSSATAKGSGTPDYAAPEQVMGNNADARSDLYSLGTLLYAMLTGEVPFQTANFLDVMRRKATEDAPPLPPDAGVPRELAGLVAELLAREPDRRPAAARQVAARLRALLDRSGRGEAAVEVQGSVALDETLRVGGAGAGGAVRAVLTAAGPEAPLVWGPAPSQDQVAPPEPSAWEPLAATGATVLSGPAAVEVRGRSLLPASAPAPPPEPAAGRERPFPWRPVLIRALLLLVAAAVTLAVVFATG